MPWATNLPRKAQVSSPLSTHPPCVRRGGPPAARGRLALGQPRLPGRPVPYLFTPSVLFSVPRGSRTSTLLITPNSPPFPGCSKAVFSQGFYLPSDPRPGFFPTDLLEGLLWDGVLHNWILFAAGGRTTRTTTMAPGFVTIVDPPTWGILVAAL